MNLVTRDVEASCRKLLDKYKDNCSGFVRAVSDDLMLYLPGASGNATEQVDFMKLLLGSHARTIDSLKYLGDGKSAEPDAVRLAKEGNFVVCGMTQKELQRNRAGKTVANGHVAVVVGVGVVPGGHWHTGARKVALPDAGKV